MKLKYSFDDEVISKFCYDMDNSKIEIHFTGYTDLLKGERLLDAPCTFVIEGWKKANSKIGDDEKVYELDKHMGIFSMILYMKLNDDNLEMLVNTIDNRYVTLIFINPEISLEY